MSKPQSARISHVIFSTCVYGLCVVVRMFNCKIQFIVDEAVHRIRSTNGTFVTHSPEYESQTYIYIYISNQCGRLLWSCPVVLYVFINIYILRYSFTCINMYSNENTFKYLWAYISQYENI